MATYFLNPVGKIIFFLKEIWENTFIWNLLLLNLQNGESIALKIIFTSFNDGIFNFLWVSLGGSKKLFYLGSPSINTFVSVHEEMLRKPEESIQMLEEQTFWGATLPEGGLLLS